MFSSAVSSGSKPAPSSIKGAMLPRTVMVPSEGSRTPAMHLSMVDLPEPFVPTRPTTSPFLTLNEMWLRARNSLKNSSCLMALMKYSLRLLSTSEAMLKIIETSSTSMEYSSSGVAGKETYAMVRLVS